MGGYIGARVPEAERSVSLVAAPHEPVADAFIAAEDAPFRRTLWRNGAITMWPIFNGLHYREARA